MSNTELWGRGELTISIMELNTIERNLWDEFVKILSLEVKKQIDEFDDNTDPLTGMMMLESTIDILATVHSRIPRTGIKQERIAEIIGGAAYLIKKKLLE